MSRAAQAAALNLRVDHMTAEVLGAFEAADIPVILLKGPGITRWLYQDEPRYYQDCDLIVPPVAIDNAERILRRLGFTPELERSKMPAWWREHAIGWRGQARLAGTVDLHGTLTGVGVDDDRLWQILATETEMMTVGGISAPVLSLPARALHVALHAAQHGGDRGELERAVVRVEEGIWSEAARLAGDLNATAAFATGLRLVAEGRALAARLELPSGQSSEVTLRAARASSQALTVDRIARASGVRERIAIVRHKLLPPPTFMRYWSGLARRGRAGLLLAYCRRLLWVVGSGPSALRAWRRARRTAQGEPPGGG